MSSFSQLYNPLAVCFQGTVQTIICVVFSCALVLGASATLRPHPESRALDDSLVLIHTLDDVREQLVTTTWDLYEAQSTFRPSTTSWDFYEHIVPAPPVPDCEDYVPPQGWVWYDADGPTYNCNWYKLFQRCNTSGDASENFGKVAQQACCHCGGGGTPSPTPVPTPKPTATPNSAKEDLRVHNLAGEVFDVNKPAEYSIVRLPKDLTQPALIELRAVMNVSEESSCSLYTTSATLTGEWLAGQTIQIRAHKRNTPGSNFAGDATPLPFALRVLSASAVDAEYWRPFANFTTSDAAAVEALTHNVTVAAVKRNEFGSRLEAQAFEFHLGSEKTATLIVAQASHQALSIEFAGIQQLGEEEVGGLLGTENHDKSIEEFTQNCKQAKMKERIPELIGGSAKWAAPFLKASWQ